MKNDFHNKHLEILQKPCKNYYTIYFHENPIILNEFTQVVTE